MSQQQNAPQGSMIAGAYAVAFMAASLVAVAGIATTSVFRALEAWDDRKDRKQRGSRPRPVPSQKPVVKVTPAPSPQKS